MSGLVGRLMMAAFVVLLACAAIEHWFSVTLIPGMAPIGRQLEIVGEIGVMLSGAFPMVKFAERHSGGAIRGLARLLRIDSTASLGMIVSIANPLPMYVTLNRMTPEGRGVLGVFRPACLLAITWVHHCVPRRHDSDVSRKILSRFPLHDRALPCPAPGAATGRGKDGLPSYRITPLSRFNKIIVLIGTDRYT